MLINTLTAKERKKGEGPLSLSLSLFEGTTKPPRRQPPQKEKEKNTQRRVLLSTKWMLQKIRSNNLSIFIF